MVHVCRHPVCGIDDGDEHSLLQFQGIRRQTQRAFHHFGVGRIGHCAH